MRGLSVICIAVSAGLHVAGFLLLGLGGRVPAAATPTLVPLQLMAATKDEAATAVHEAAPAAPVPVPAATAPAEPRADEVLSWRQSASVPTPSPDPPPRATEPATEPVAPAAPTADAPQPEVAATPVKSEQAWRPGPPPGLRLPPSILRGKAAADLVIDPRSRDFLPRARQLGMQFILFQDNSLAFYLELCGDDLRTVRRRTEIDGARYSRRARDLAGVRSFDKLRDDVAERYGLDPGRCRLAALVPLSVDETFRQAETAALASLNRPADAVRALCGVLTGDGSRPLQIDHALTADGRWLEVTP